MKESVFFAIVLAALTQSQSTVILGILVLVVVLLVVGYFKSIHRLSELEQAVFTNRKATKEILRAGRENLQDSS